MNLDQHPPADPPSHPPADPPTNPQTRLDQAILNLEQAQTEVDRLCTIIERAAVALTAAREVRKSAQIELDQVSKEFSLANGGDVTSVEVSEELTRDRNSMDEVGRDLVPIGRAKSMDPEEDNVGYGRVYSEERSVGSRSSSGSRSSDESGSDASESLGGASSRYSSEGEYDDVASEEDYVSEKEGSKDHDESAEEIQSQPNDFDMSNEALDQIRYRLQVAKIDPISAQGTQLLDELLVRFQNTKETITIDLVNRYIDELLLVEKKEGSEQGGQDKDENRPVSSKDKNIDGGDAKYAKEQQQTTTATPSSNTNNPKRIRINRGGKVLGWYEGSLDSRGYARSGKGSMYYDAGHECHGNWKNDEMIGRGVYIWADGHRYDGEWENGKRHGLGRFIRPDGVVLYGRYEKGHHRGEGVRWSADRKEAQSMVDGVPKKSVSLAIAEFMALKLGFEDVPPPPGL